jgi:ribosome biogenesis GTPase / thiamine phosphate phosphatase
MSTDIPHDLGVVIKKTIGNYNVHLDGRTLACTLATRLRKEFVYQADNPNTGRHVVKAVKAIEHSDPVAVGDIVHIAETQDSSGVIVEIMPRRNQLARRTAVPMPTAHPFEQVIAANVDQVVPVFAAARPAPKWNMLDRYLASAESLDLPALVCMTKLDLARAGEGLTEADLKSTAAEYQRIGYPVLFTSAVTGEGIAELKQALQGRISVLVGKSGVGKTSLLNALQPGLGLRVNEVNQTTGKGKHTTSHVEMLLLEVGGAIIDTPGVREFGLWDLDTDDLASFFPEMRPFVGKCRFGLDCQHDEEPGCAIRKAVMGGQVSPRRYQSYMRLKAEGYFYD